MSDSPLSVQAPGHPLAKLLPRLSWLGITASQFATYVPPHADIEEILSLCKRLRTILIRGSHHDETADHVNDLLFPLQVAKMCPNTVTRLELRMYYPLLEQLVLGSKSAGFSIKHIGIDFGAWVQVFHQPHMTGQAEAAAANAGKAAAQNDRFEAHERLHNETFAAGTKWYLPESELHVESPPNDTHFTTSQNDKSLWSGSFSGPQNGFERDFYSSGGSSLSIRPPTTVRELEESCNSTPGIEPTRLFDRIIQAQTMTLPAMLNDLHDTAKEHPEIILFALQPEWQKRSTDPVHPLALVQAHRSNGVTGRASIRSNVYAWLGKTFRWRPVFDWDWFVNPDPNNTKSDLPEQYEHLRTFWNGYRELIDDPIIDEIARNFQMMRDAGIPLHLLIGRRDSNGSSLYWGWPYKPTAWREWLDSPFEANMELIAPLIDTLTVSYDLRNPLDEDYSEGIDARDTGSDERGNAVCPRPVCPWKNTDRACPFGCQNKPPSPTRSFTPSNTQKMANKKPISPGNRYKNKLASQVPGNPPSGEYAQDWPVEEEDPEDGDANSSLHAKIRHAALNREAVGWQRFWSVYAPQLTNLSELRVRMPHCFDKIGSVRLANLFMSESHWHMVPYADERQHMQTLPDVSAFWNNDADDDSDESFACVLEPKVWPAGRFVRRTWVRLPPQQTSSSVEGGKRLYRMEDEAHPHTHYNNGDNEAEIEAREHEELERAIDRADAAATAVQEKENELKSQQQYPEPTSDPENNDIEAHLQGLYGRRIRRIAKEAWRKQLHDYMDELRNSLEPMSPHASIEDRKVRNLMFRTLGAWNQRSRSAFRAADIFAYRGEDSEFRNGIGLKRHKLDYTKQESRERNGSPEVRAPDSSERDPNAIWELYKQLDEAEKRGYMRLPPKMGEKGPGIPDIDTPLPGMKKPFKLPREPFKLPREGRHVEKATKRVRRTDGPSVEQAVQIDQHTEVEQGGNDQPITIDQTTHVTKTIEVKQEGIDTALAEPSRAKTPSPSSPKYQPSSPFTPPLRGNPPPPRTPPKYCSPPPHLDDDPNEAQYEARASRGHEPEEITQPAEKAPSKAKTAKGTRNGRVVPETAASSDGDEKKPPRPPAATPAPAPKPPKRRRIDPVLDTSLPGFAADVSGGRGSRRSATPVNLKEDESLSESSTSDGEELKKRTKRPKKAPKAKKEKGEYREDEDGEKGEGKER